MKIYIQDAKKINRQQLLANHCSRYATTLKSDLKQPIQEEHSIGYHNLIYVGSTEECLSYQEERDTKVIVYENKITNGHFTCPLDITKEELWSCHNWLVSHNYPDSLYQILKEEGIQGRKNSLLCLIWRLNSLLSNNQDICLAFLQEQAINACTILEKYITFLHGVLTSKPLTDKVA